MDARPPDGATARLERCYTSVVHDVMRAMGLRDFTFPAELRPLDPANVLCGPAFTVEGEARQAEAHDTLLAWTGLLSKAPAGTVWVAQPHDRMVAHMGELSAETLKGRGVRGCIVDGYIRDTAFLLEIGFQAWSRGSTPRDIVGHWLPKAVEAEIDIGGVTVATGDYVLGDRDGLVRIPRGAVADVLDGAESAMAAENLVRRAIREGVDPQEAYLRHGKF